MNLLPQDSETFVVSRKAHEVQIVLAQASVSENLVQNRKEHVEKLFVGWVKENKFQLSIRPKRPNSFLPVMKGKMESTSTGSILFVTYNLFPSTRLYLSFWSLFSVITGIILFFQLSTVYVPVATIGVLVSIHYIAWANFKMQVRISRDILLKSLSQ
jgi:hypothetical protein